eukprot:s314_g23.t1
MPLKLSLRKSISLVRACELESGCGQKDCRQIGLQVASRELKVFIRQRHVAERVEELVTQHNRCGGQLWVGGSQPPLLLAFLNLKQAGTSRLALVTSSPPL